MAVQPTEEPGTLETDSVLVRTMREGDLEAVVSIDAATTGRRRPRYFELMLERALRQAAPQVSLSAGTIPPPRGRSLYPARDRLGLPRVLRFSANGTPERA